MPTEETKVPNSNDSANTVGTRLFMLIDRWIVKTVNGGLVIAVIGAVAILVINVADTLGRAFLHKPLMGTVEITEALLAVTVLMALGSAQMKGEHIAVDILFNKFGVKAQHILLLLISLVATGLYLFISWRFLSAALDSYAVREVSAGYLGVPIWLSKLVSACGVIIAFAESARQLVRLLLNARKTPVFK